MIEILILYELSKQTSTMYGISKEIKSDLSVLTIPSIGTIKPALVRLESSGFIKSSKSMSKGGRPSVYYSITDAGRIALRGYIKFPIKENPVQFLNSARVRLYCADALSTEELYQLIDMLKIKIKNLMADTDRLVERHESDFYPRMVLDNLNCEYKNFLSLLEGVERACKH